MKCCLNLHVSCEKVRHFSEPSYSAETPTRLSWALPAPAPNAADAPVPWRSEDTLTNGDLRSKPSTDGQLDIPQKGDPSEKISSVPGKTTHRFQMCFFKSCLYMFTIWVWVKIRYPNNWMVNSELD